MCRYSLLLLLVASSAVLGLPSLPDQFYAPPVEQVKPPSQFYKQPIIFPSTEPTPVSSLALSFVLLPLTIINKCLNK